MAESTTLSQFLALSAHDIKQPLNVLQMYLGILQRRANSDSSDELGQVVSDSMKSVQATLNLLSQWARANENSLKEQRQAIEQEQWLQLLASLKGVDHHDGSAPCDPQTTDAERIVDLALLQQTVQDIIQLLPNPVELHCGDTPWTLILQCPPLGDSNMGDSNTGESDGGEPHYHDALYQLAINAGSAILTAMGGRFSTTSATDSGQSILTLSL